MDESILTYSYQTDLVGFLEIRVTNSGVRSIEFGSTRTRFKERPEHPVLARLLAELDTYFTGRPIVFRTPRDLGTGTEFQRKVWDALTRIPYGETRSYSDVAAMVGNPRAARAVGSANGSNQIPILIPCHRVICRDGELGGYSSGLDIKRALLHLEGVTLMSVSKRKKG
jgi:methylated-DNA-[protein]-cysteine S-methyltransferase